MSTDTDTDLVRRTAAGEQEALARLFDAHAPAVTRYVWALAETRMDVEEIVQDAFVTLWQKADAITIHGDSVLPWLLVVAKNHSRNLRRKQARTPSDQLPDELESPATSAASDDARERLRWVRDEIELLSPLDREICQLCLVDGRSYPEAAALLGLSVGAVTQRVSRSRARLKKAVNTDER